MKRHAIPAAVVSLLAALVSVRAETAPPSPAAAMPPDMEAAVDGRFGADCQALDLPRWHHPTRLVIEKRPEAHLQWVVLCRNQTFPVFGMDFDYDPQGQTDSFFHPLFHDLLTANGHWAYAIVDARDDLVITISGGKKDTLTVDYAGLAEAP